MLALCQSVYSAMSLSEPRLTLPDPSTLLRDKGGRVMCVDKLLRTMCPAECRVVWYGGGLPMDAISSRTCRAGDGGIVEGRCFGRRMRRGDGMIGEPPTTASALGTLEGGVVVVMGVVGGLTALRLTCLRCG